MKINKGIILCGGLGTRFLPVTKSLPKEMLPIVDTPVLEFIVQEMIESGVTEICIVVSPGKDDIVRHFSEDKGLNAKLSAAGKAAELKQVSEIGKGAKFTFVTQYEPKGMAHALLCARDFAGNDPFILSTGDDYVMAKIPVSSQMVAAMDEDCDALIGGQWVPDDKTHLYGIADITNEKGDNANKKSGNALGRKMLCKTIVEKPKSNPPSNYAALGRYILSSKIFDKITQIKPDSKGELQVTDALRLICAENRGYFYNFEGIRYDMGNKAGAVKGILDYALVHPETKAEITAYIKELAKSL